MFATAVFIHVCAISFWPGRCVFGATINSVLLALGELQVVIREFARIFASALPLAMFSFLWRPSAHVILFLVVRLFFFAALSPDGADETLLQVACRPFEKILFAQNPSN